MEKIEHPIEPVYDGHSKTLILGTIPSPKSRETGFYYGHPQNRFWRVVSTVLQETTPVTNEEKIVFLRKHRIALWDVLASCDIEGADDGSIQNPVPNDINRILYAAAIETIFTTGRKATVLYAKYCFPHTGRQSVYLPSTSPANCRFYTFDELAEAYAVLKKY